MSEKLKNELDKLSAEGFNAYEITAVDILEMLETKALILNEELKLSFGQNEYRRIAGKISQLENTVSNIFELIRQKGKMQWVMINKETGEIIDEI